MQFKPKSEQEIANDGLWPEQIVDFEVLEAEDTTSRNGDDMVKMKIKVFNEEGGSRTVYEYLLGTDSMQWKVRAFCAATGLLEQYETGELEAVEMEGRTGKAKLVIQKDKSGSYPDKNAIGAYIAQAEKPKAAAPSRSVAKPAERRQPGGVSWDAPRAAGGGGIDDDSIPFAACWQ
jgi:hypothetical protein